MKAIVNRLLPRRLLALALLIPVFAYAEEYKPLVIPEMDPDTNKAPVDIRYRVIPFMGSMNNYEVVPDSMINFGRGDERAFFNPGAGHMFDTSNVSFGLCTFDSTTDYPLNFKLVAGKGYVYLCGRGSVRLPNRKTVTLGENDKVGVWIARMESPDETIREGAALALGWLGTVAEEQERPRAVAALTGALKDTSASVRRAAVESLGRIRDVGTVEVLRKMLEDKNERCREIAKWAIDGITKGVSTHKMKQTSGKQE